MSSVKVSTKALSQKRRMEIIRDNIVPHTYGEIALMCGVTKRTIRRDVVVWKKKGGYDEHLLEEYFRLYRRVEKENVERAFDRVCDLLRRRDKELDLATNIDNIRLKWAMDEEIKTNQNAV